MVGSLRALIDFGLDDPMSGALWVVLWTAGIFAWLCCIVRIQEVVEREA